MKKYSEEFRDAMTDVEVVNISKNTLPEYTEEWDAGCDVRVDFSRITSDEPLKTKGDCQFLFENEVNPLKSFILQVYLFVFQKDMKYKYAQDLV